ncbi:NAD-dependent succinate-semialdehyde dehydrogenase [Neoactinobaculum massilliense]|uniref:NAD-dependent succinate-semialdehyde dehydrogenase n=1 Tax=Neoactinobaculum massilliense TaxID=2364794 RepID=UPI000F535D2C|nr:NAD-dependent succinate-semialdehyde dehydrogenase [Neoactinobaculum massilliense]
MAYATTNPYTGKVEKTFPTASATEVDAAIAKAHGAFLEWKELPFEERAEVLHRAAQILAENKRAYAEIVTREMGKLVAEAEAEIDICVGMLEYYVKRGADEMAPHFVKAGGLGDTDVMVVNEPMGVIYAVEPWNFPYYQVIRICAPQFTAGNAILLKHASIVPQSALAMEDLFAKAGAPEGLLTAVFAGHEATAQVLADPRVRGVALTGSEGAGAAVAAEAGRNLKKSTLELGGADAYVVLEDADLDKAVQWAVIGRNWNAGQVCVSSKRIIVADALYDDFVAKYRARARQNLVAGDPMDSATTLAPLSSQDAVDQLTRQVEHAKEEGATVEEIGIELPDQGTFFQPMIITDIPEGSDTRHTEFFGPVAQFYRAKDEEDAIRIANDTPFGLGGSVFSRDIHHAQAVARRIDTGMVYINQPTGVKAEIPFGGTKRSGYGRELTELGLKEFVNQKVVAVRDIDGEF